MKKFLYSLSTGLIVLFSLTAGAQQIIQYTGNWGPAGFSVENQDNASLQVNFSVPEFTMEDITINGKSVKSIGLPGVFLFNNAGAPNIPGTGRYICIPQGATAVLEVLSTRTETIHNVDLAQAPRIPKENEDGLDYPIDNELYSTNAFYPAQAVQLSAPTKIRGVDVVMLGISPFQYNPVTKELLVYQDIKLKIHFQGANNHFGEDRLRSRWFDPLLQDMLLNPRSLPKMDYNKSALNTEDVGFEYLIIVPNDAYFSQWADTIKQFRTRQGISTGVKTLADVGGNTVVAIENYINNAYNTWSVPPVACLLIGDFGSNAANTIVSPIWDSYCASDNIYGDVDGNSMPDVVMARMTAQDAAQLEVMVRKFIDYERNPPTSEGFYDHPITALGWQTERWFQVCSEVIGGFWQNSLGKNPVRVNAVYDGDPSVDPWSTATNTSTVVNYFGPGGLGYIPATPQGLTGWTGGDANGVNLALNNGAFMLQHRDHGFEAGWGEPDYSSPDIDALTNTDLSYIMSVNCLTGKFNYSSEVFAEKFHRYTYNNQPAGALGILAATEISYSFVNDAFIWGVYDNLWPGFMPGYGSTPAERGILPAFGNAAGKYFLEQSSWPYNPSEKEVTYNLFHHHGDAFLTVYSEVPQVLGVIHNPIIFTGESSFVVTADSGALICLSMNGIILGTGTGNGSPLAISIPGNQVPPDHLDVVVTLQNYLRYEAEVAVIPPTGPYVVRNNVIISDVTGNSNGMVDYGEIIQLTLDVKNVGVMPAENVNVSISSTDPYITMIAGSSFYGDIAVGGIISMPLAFSFSVAANIPDNHPLAFVVASTDGTNTWLSFFTLVGHAAEFVFHDYAISDLSGNNNSRLDPGETVIFSVVMKNTGSARADNVMGTLSSSDPYITLSGATQAYGDVAGDSLSIAYFSVTADAATPSGHTAIFDMLFTADLGISGTGSFSLVIGQIPVLIIDLDPDHSSGSQMNTTIQSLGVTVDYETSMPINLDIYSSIFLCLGVYSNVHVLAPSEGQSLANYLDNGGNLYMEGGDTWAYDAETVVHPMFKIDGTNDGSGDLYYIDGVASGITAGMDFTYSGGNNYIDHISPMGGSTALTILNNNTPAYGTAVSYDGGSYRTIGASHEFGGITGNNCPSTKANLMYEYLRFFGILDEGLNAVFSVTDTSSCVNTLITFHDNSLGACPDAWFWEFPGGIPATSVAMNPVVYYYAAGDYNVRLIVSNGAHTDTLFKANYIHVITAPDQPNIPSGPSSICNNVPFSTYTTGAVNGATTYSWYMIPMSAGTVSGSTTSAAFYWNASYSGAAYVYVKAVNACGEGLPSSSFSVDLKQAPIVTQQNFTDICTYWGAFLLSGGLPAGGTYSGTGINNGWYEPWQVPLGNNNITYTYTETNGCSAAVTKNIYVDPCTAISIPDPNQFSMEIFPNPVGSMFTVVLKGMSENSCDIKITNILGEQIVGEQFTGKDGEMTLRLNSNAWSSGIYFISLKTGKEFISRKFVVD